MMILSQLYCFFVKINVYRYKWDIFKFSPFLVAVA